MSKADTKEKNTKLLIKELLAQQLGVETDDIEDEDSLVLDLHMRPVDISDLIETLENNGIDTSNLDLGEIDSFSDLVEALAIDEFL